MREQASNSINVEMVHMKDSIRFPTYRLINNLPKLRDVEQFLQITREKTIHLINRDITRNAAKINLSPFNYFARLN